MGGGRGYILLDYGFKGRAGGINIVIDITSVTFCIPSYTICLPNLIRIGAGAETFHRARISSVTLGEGLATGTGRSLNA